jgi:acyl carrier protein
VVDTANFSDDLDADDLSVEMIMNFGQEFGCDISDDDAEAILTVSDAIKFLEKNASILATDA